MGSALPDAQCVKHLGRSSAVDHSSFLFVFFVFLTQASNLVIFPEADNLLSGGGCVFAGSEWNSMVYNDII